MNRLFVNKTKTIALLIYVRTTLEQLFSLIEKKEYALKVLEPEDSKSIIEKLEELLNNLEESKIMNDNIFRSTMDNCKTFNPYYEELVEYYNCIVIQIEENMKNGDLWIPEQFILCLLSQWILEENHNQYFYYLNDIDYLKLLEKFETIDHNENKEYRKKVTQMYKISINVIEQLKNVKYNQSTKKSKKKR